MAIDGTYEISVEAGKRRETGTATISTRGETVRLDIKAPVVGRIEAVGKAGPDNSFSASGKLRILLKRVDYKIAGRVTGDNIAAVCETNLGTIEVTGKRID